MPQLAGTAGKCGRAAPPRRSARIVARAPAAALVLALGCGTAGEGPAPAPPAGRALRAAAATATEPPEAALRLIDSEDLRARLAFFASDHLEGRRAGTRGADLAAAYLASELARLGLASVFPDSSYLQRFGLPGAGREPAGGAADGDSTQNVVAVVPGADPALATQYVVLGAHYDHVGIGPAVDGDSIYNGADDDGSGTVALLEVAEALAQGPRPRRSVLVVFHGAEELGLLGSFYFTLRPPVPRDSLVAMLNVDMVGRNAPDSLAVIGAGRISSELERILHEEARATGLQLDESFDAPDHPERLYYRSDHYNYAQYGIPVAFLFAGLHPDYHQPSDEVQKVDFEKVERVAGLLYRVAWRIAERDAPLERDRAHR